MSKWQHSAYYDLPSAVMKALWHAGDNAPNHPVPTQEKPVKTPWNPKSGCYFTTDLRGSKRVYLIAQAMPDDNGLHFQIIGQPYETVAKFASSFNHRSYGAAAYMGYVQNPLHEEALTQVGAALISGHVPLYPSLNAVVQGKKDTAPKKYGLVHVALRSTKHGVVGLHFQVYCPGISESNKPYGVSAWVFPDDYISTSLGAQAFTVFSTYYNLLTGGAL